MLLATYLVAIVLMLFIMSGFLNASIAKINLLFQIIIEAYVMYFSSVFEAGLFIIKAHLL